jgi:hypothetical protein
VGLGPRGGRLDVVVFFFFPTGLGVLPGDFLVPVGGIY